MLIPLTIVLEQGFRRFSRHVLVAAAVLACGLFATAPVANGQMMVYAPAQPVVSYYAPMAAGYPGGYVAKGESKAEIDSFKAAMGWLMDQAKKGQAIQRYKGLGEMNPEQLWDTTINPETRRLIQVRIEDAVAADDLFTTLMGDQVEPRRDFIETNALRAGNIDV